MRIDAHHHLWDPKRGDYLWMSPDDPTLWRVYAPDDLRPHLKAHEIDRTILVQAAATIAETDYMLELAEATDYVAGVVGWIDFEHPDQRATLERFAAHPKFRGVRPMIQDTPDDNWMLRDDVQWAFQALIDLNLTFDALGFPRHLENFLTIFSRYPDLRVVVDHCMKPEIARGAIKDWANGMTRIAEETGAYCKLSGLVTEAGPDWSAEALEPYARHVLDAFGAGRVMWGSDWPVCRKAAEYDRWFETARSFAEPLGEDAQARIFGETAAEFYGLGGDL